MFDIFLKLKRQKSYSKQQTKWTSVRYISKNEKTKGIRSKKQSGPLQDNFPKLKRQKVFEATKKVFFCFNDLLSFQFWKYFLQMLTCAAVSQGGPQHCSRGCSRPSPIIQLHSCTLLQLHCIMDIVHNMHKSYYTELNPQCTQVHCTALYTVYTL